MNKKTKESSHAVEQRENRNTRRWQVGNLLCRYTPFFACAFFIALTMSGTALAAGQADALWGTVTEMIGTWVMRLGAVVMFVGGIMFGLGWKSDDAEQKSRGVSTIIAGGIVMAVAGVAGTFLA